MGQMEEECCFRYGLHMCIFIIIFLDFALDSSVMTCSLAELCPTKLGPFEGAQCNGLLWALEEETQQCI